MPMPSVHHRAAEGNTSAVLLSDTLISSMCKAALPVTLCHDAIVQILLPVIQINRILRVTEQEISQAHHIVDRAVLLIFVSQSCLQLVRRAPDLTAGLTSGHIRSTVCDCTLPIRPRNIQTNAAHLSLHRLPPHQESPELSCSHAYLSVHLFLQAVRQKDSCGNSDPSMCGTSRPL